MPRNGKHCPHCLTPDGCLEQTDQYTFGAFENIYDAVSEIKVESTGQLAADASCFLFAMENFKFIRVACLNQYILSFIRPVSVNFQAKSCDRIFAYSEAMNLIKILSTVEVYIYTRNQESDQRQQMVQKMDHRLEFKL